jgi:hypothetical protein
MIKTQVSLPELGLVAGTRGALGAGVGLLLASKLSEQQRKAVGWTLVAVGVATTIPLAFEILSHRVTDGED